MTTQQYVEVTDPMTGQKRKIPVNYPVGPGHIYPRPWTGGLASLQLASIVQGNLVPLNAPASVPLQPLALPTHETPPSNMLPFNLTPGTDATQIQPTSWPCRKIVFFAPTTNAGPIYMGPQGLSVSKGGFAIPPGSSGFIDIADVMFIFWVATNDTDSITGWAESSL